MVKTNRFYKTLIIAVLVMFAGNALEVHATPILIRFSHVVSENSPKGIGAKMLQDLVEKRLSGKVKVEIYPGSQKFTDGQALRALLFGDIELAAPSFAKFRQFTSDLQVFDLPFLFENVEQVHRFQASKEGQSLLSSMLDSGIKGLRYWDNGMRVISANRSIKTPADLRGLTFRIESSNVFYQQYSRLGATPLSLPFNQLSDTLRDGTIDGYENCWSNIYSQRLHKLRPHFTEMEHSFLGYMLVTNNTFWNSLPPDIRIELNHIIDEVTIEVNRIATKQAEDAKLAIMQSNKSSIIHLNNKQRQLWKEEMAPIWKSFESSIAQEIITAATNNRMQPISDQNKFLADKMTNAQ